jgi:glycosyltransferase involved in cell wall biosynthesis
MRILYISDSAIPSASPNSVHVMKMCQALVSLGHTVTLIGKNAANCIIGVKDIHAFYAVEKCFDIKIFPFRAFKGSGMFYNVSFLWRALFFRAELLYTRSLTAAFFLLLYGKEVAFEVHEPYEGKNFRIRSMFAYIVRSKRLKKLIVISQALRKYYIKNLSINPDKVIVAHDGADPFKEASPFIVDDYFKAGYIGSLYSGKGMEILLPLARECRDIAFHVIGGDIQQIEKLKSENGDLKNVVFHGFKPQYEIPGYLASFDVLMAPYTSTVIVSQKQGANNLALWMSPLKIFEYMAAGKPIIATSLPVIQEILHHEKNALLCAPENPGQWKDAIESLRKCPELRTRLGREAMADFTRSYTWKKRAEWILNSLA